MTDTALQAARRASPPIGATREDILRALDRSRVRGARLAGRHARLFWLLAGPGVLVMLGENDGPSMVSYATTGATYGVGFFAPFILLTFVMAFVVQEMTVRLGVGDASRPRRADLPALRPVLGLFRDGRSRVRQSADAGDRIHRDSGRRPLFRPAVLAVGRARRAIVLASLGLRRYATWERALMGLAVGNLLFVPAALLAHPDGAALAHALATWGPLPGDGRRSSR